MGNLPGNLAVALLRLIFFVFGIAATVFSARHLMKVLRLGRFPRWDGQVVAFADSPVWGSLYLVRVALALLAALVCVALPVWLFAKAG
jgi:hypothetical protein